MVEPGDDAAAEDREGLMETFFVEVVEDNSQKVVRCLECTSLRQAEKVQRGLEINLNQNAYSTRIVDKDFKEIEGA